MDFDAKQITDLGRLLYTARDIARLMQVSDTEVAEAMADTSSDFAKAYWTGYYETDVKLRGAIIKLATAGSGPAQLLLKKITEQHEFSR